MKRFLRNHLYRLLLNGTDEFIFRKPVYPYQAYPAHKTHLYVHVPFCKNLCPYCPYYRVPFCQESVTEYFSAVSLEAKALHQRCGKLAIESIYIGGGTPTHSSDLIAVLLNEIRGLFIVNGPIAMEAHPLDINRALLRSLTSSGISMLSVGVQSFEDKHLHTIGRNHSGEEARRALKLCASVNTLSINCDLIFAIPGQTVTQFEQDILQAIEAGADQITFYPLFTFPWAEVQKYKRKNRIGMPPILKRKQMYEHACKLLLSRGYERASVWSFKRPQAPHYSSVTRTDFVGLGAGAASLSNEIYSFNTFSASAYVEALQKGKSPVSLTMPLSKNLSTAYKVYWAAYETFIQRSLVTEVMQISPKVAAVTKALSSAFGLVSEEDQGFRLTQAGSFWVHLLQNYLALNFVSSVWGKSKKNHWPDKVYI